MTSHIDTEILKNPQNLNLDQNAVKEHSKYSCLTQVFSWQNLVQPISSKLSTNRKFFVIQQNTLLYYSLIATSFSVASFFEAPVLIGALLTYSVIFVALDLFEYGLNIPVWNQTERTSNCYNWFEHYLAKNYDKNKDYSEGIFDGNPAMDLKTATLNKYNYIFDKLELQAGMKLLDMGCGTGKWMDYCKERGIDVVGLTLSELQAEEVRKKGLNVHVLDYRVLHPSFINSFDRITALGSSEHISSARGCLLPRVAQRRCNKIRADSWNLFYQYLKQDGKCYMTMLTINDHVKKWSLVDRIQAYIIERHYGAFCSTLEDITENVAPQTKFVLSDIQDKTKDYHWSSMADPDHFGNWKIKWSEDFTNKIYQIIRGLLFDPFLVHHFMYYFCGTWMWQLGGCKQTMMSDEEIKNSPLLLKYMKLEK